MAKKICYGLFLLTLFGPVGLLVPIGGTALGYLNSIMDSLNGRYSFIVDVIFILFSLLLFLSKERFNHFKGIFITLGIIYLSLYLVMCFDLYSHSFYYHYPLHYYSIYFLHLGLVLYLIYYRLKKE